MLLGDLGHRLVGGLRLLGLLPPSRSDRDYAKAVAENWTREVKGANERAEGARGEAEGISSKARLERLRASRAKNSMEKLVEATRWREKMRGRLNASE